MQAGHSLSVSLPESLPELLGLFELPGLFEPGDFEPESPGLIESFWLFEPGDFEPDSSAESSPGDFELESLPELPGLNCSSCMAWCPPSEKSNKNGQKA